MKREIGVIGMATVLALTGASCSGKKSEVTTSQTEITASIGSTETSAQVYLTADQLIDKYYPEGKGLEVKQRGEFVTGLGTKISLINYSGAKMDIVAAKNMYDYIQGNLLKPFRKGGPFGFVRTDGEREKVVIILGQDDSNPKFNKEEYVSATQQEGDNEGTFSFVRVAPYAGVSSEKAAEVQIYEAFISQNLKIESLYGNDDKNFEDIVRNTAQMIDLSSSFSYEDFLDGFLGYREYNGVPGIDPTLGIAIIPSEPMYREIPSERIIKDPIQAPPKNYSETPMI